MDSIRHQPKTAIDPSAQHAHQNAGERAATASSAGTQLSRPHSSDGVLQALPQRSLPGAAVRKRSRSAPPVTTAQRRMLAELGAEADKGLTPDEAAVLRELTFHTPATPCDTVLFTDPNKDPDDVAAYTIGKQLQVAGFVRLTDVAVTLGAASVREQRARLAKGVFNRLHLPDVRVSRGQDYPISAKQAKDHDKFLQEGHALRAESGEICGNSLQAMQDRLVQAPQGLSMVVIAGMTDANALADAYPALVAERVKTITIMGGVEPAKDADGYVQPDTRAYNNATDLHAARGLYRKAQQLHIPLRIVTKEAAYKTAVSPLFYESLAKSGHCVGKYLKDVQKNALNGLWDGIQAGRLPGLDAAWFFRTFTADALPQTNSPQDGAKQAIAFDQIWPNVTKLNLYDPLTLLAAVPGAAGMLFTPRQIHTDGLSVVELVSEKQVKHPEKAKLLMSALAKAALASKKEE
ncbi:type III secretion system effector protein [Xanthomonas populi]|uniref:Type III secretion system effector protein n=1 Tax=Xanthomonas populi TaxID=53414 RepID=A0A2S7E6P2_9XANT|nr:type III secretion system effector XopQ [Xanthomonas populi]PPU85784.1 type III secretion system effector protein [Xanthomonas populi]